MPDTCSRTTLRPPCVFLRLTASSPSDSDFQPQLFLIHTVANSDPANPLESHSCKNSRNRIKLNAFNLCRMHSCDTPPRNSFRITRFQKTGGRGRGVPGKATASTSVVNSRVGTHRISRFGFRIRSAHPSSLSAASISDLACSSPFFRAHTIPVERISRASAGRANRARNCPK